MVAGPQGTNLPRGPVFLCPLVPIQWTVGLESILENPRGTLLVQLIEPKTHVLEVYVPFLEGRRLGPKGPVVFDVMILAERHARAI